MKFTRRAPCPNCPFRKDVKLAHWHPSMYLMLQHIEKTEGNPFETRTFGCHKDRHEPKEEHEYCVGWIINQREKGVPSIALRLVLSQYQDPAIEQYEESEPDGELYETIEELVEANLERDRKLNPQRYDEEGNYVGDEA